MSAPERFMPAFFDRNRQHPPHHAASYQPPPQPPRPLSPGQSDPLYYGPSADRRATLNPFADHLHDDSAPLAATNFLDNILNPAGYDHNSFLPYSYRTSTILDGMPPNTRAHAQASSRPARLPNGYVDLTSTPDSPPQRRKRDSPSPGPSAKRQKRDNGSSREQAKAEPATIEEVDLTDDKAPVQNILQKQREDAIKAQIPQEEKATTFNTFTCVICMDTPTDLTATSCGMSFAITSLATISN